MISDSVISIIKHSRKSLPFDKTSAWVKKVDSSYDHVKVLRVCWILLVESIRYCPSISITIKINFIETDFLDVTFNLEKETLNMNMNMIALHRLRYTNHCK